MSWIKITSPQDNRITVNTIAEVVDQDDTHYTLVHWNLGYRYQVRIQDTESFTPLTGTVTYKNRSCTFIKYLEDCPETPNSYCSFTGKRARIKDITTEEEINVYTSQLT